MKNIKGLHKIAQYLSEDEVNKLDQGAALYKRHSNITFNILSVTDKAVTIQVLQGKHIAKNYLDQKELISRGKDLFSKFLTAHKIHVHATPYEDHYITKIDEKWIAKQMLEKGVKAKDIIAETGIDKANVSNWLSGSRPMSQIVKAMMYYYFSSKS